MAQEGGIQDRADELRDTLIVQGEPDRRELDEQARYAALYDPRSDSDVESEL